MQNEMPPKQTTLKVSLCSLETCTHKTHRRHIKPGVKHRAENKWKFMANFRRSSFLWPSLCLSAGFLSPQREYSRRLFFMSFSYHFNTLVTAPVCFAGCKFVEPNSCIIPYEKWIKKVSRHERICKYSSVLPNRQMCLVTLYHISGWNSE